MPDIEQPAEGADASTPDEFAQIAEILGPDMPDPDEVEEEQLLDVIETHALRSATYWATLRANDIPARECSRLTQHWMDICAWGAD